MKRIEKKLSFYNLVDLIEGPEGCLIVPPELEKIAHLVVDTFLRKDCSFERGLGFGDERSSSEEEVDFDIQTEKRLKYPTWILITEGGDVYYSKGNA